MFVVANYLNFMWDHFCNGLEMICSKLGADVQTASQTLCYDTCCILQIDFGFGSAGVSLVVCVFIYNIRTKSISQIKHCTRYAKYKIPPGT